MINFTIRQSFVSAGVLYNCTLILYGTITDPLQENSHVPSPSPIPTEGTTNVREGRYLTSFDYVSCYPYRQGWNARASRDHSSHHVIGVCLLRKAQPRKKAHIPLRFSWISQTCPPCLIITQSCYYDYRINKPFACSRCVICASCAKDHRLFYLNYPQINEVGKEMTYLCKPSPLPNQPKQKLITEHRLAMFKNVFCK